ncbi:MAG: hypothetical protein WCW67_06460 [Candidatus Margulisiibacteriota bacterium]
MKINGNRVQSWWPPHVNEIRIICPLPARLQSGRIIAELTAIGLAAHDKLKNGSDLLAPDYTRGRSQAASDELQKQLERKGVLVPLSFSLEKVIGSNFSRSIDPLGRVGEHHLLMVKFKEGAVLVDITAAEFEGRGRQFANTNVLLIPTTHEEILTNLARVYGGEWRIKGQS